MIVEENDGNKIMIHAYSTIFNLGHAAVATLLHGPVIIEEKVDGSQISFCRVTDGECYELQVRSKGAMINLLAPEGLFKKAVEILKSIEDKIPVGFTFRGEYLAKPKHNVMVYDRIPANHIIIFDIEYGEQSFCGPEEKKRVAEALGFETVPMMHPVHTTMEIQNPDEIRAFLECESVLGGQKVEGVVIKPAAYDLFGRDKKVLMGKFVSEAFKETHASEWKTLHGPKSSNDVLRELAMTYASPARWQKALVHLREEGKITGSLKDIGELFKAVPPDVLKECEEEIKATLWNWAWPQLRRSVTRGLPEWYKDLLLKKQFEPNEQFPGISSARCDHEFITGEGFASACVKCGNVAAPERDPDSGTLQNL
jgi:hypothetical protein